MRFGAYSGQPIPWWMDEDETHFSGVADLLIRIGAASLALAAIALVAAAL